MCSGEPRVRNGQWQLLECVPAWDGNWTWDGFLAFAWQRQLMREQLLVTVNYAATQGQCYVRLPFDGSDRPHGAIRRSDEPAELRPRTATIRSRGLYLDLPPWGYHVFDVTAS